MRICPKMLEDASLAAGPCSSSSFSFSSSSVCLSDGPCETFFFATYTVDTASFFFLFSTT